MKMALINETNPSAIKEGQNILHCSCDNVFILKSSQFHTDKIAMHSMELAKLGLWIYIGKLGFIKLKRYINLVILICDSRAENMKIMLFQCQILL